MPYLAPTKPSEALAFLRDAAPTIIAGCTDFFPSQAPGHVADNILDVTMIEGMRGVTETENGWRIGAATTWTDIIKAPTPPAFDALKLAAREVGSVQIQNRGTVAGNLCNASPAADGVPPLLALDAQVEISSHSATRIVPLSAFITGVRKTDLRDDELVAAIHIPTISDKAGSGFQKLGSRTCLVISIAMVAAVAEILDGRIAMAHIAVGSCSPVAQRLPNLEAKLTGTVVSDLADFDFCAQDALAPLSPISDVRGSADYRLDVVPELCRRAVLQACSEG
ncbi:MAG: FAD binding domain-containing protein [Pseudomonadota bacterium]